MTKQTDALRPVEDNRMQHAIAQARAAVQSHAAIEEHAYAVGLAAFVHGLPQVYLAKFQSMFAPRRNLKGEFAGDSADSPMRWANTLAHNRRQLNPELDKGRGGGPNVDLLYSGAWLDLSNGPLVLRTPDTAGRYHVAELISFHNHYNAHVGSRTTGNAANAFIVAGPSWQGAAPAGMQVLRCDTDEAWLLIRIYVADEADTPAVNALQDGFSLAPLQAAPGRPSDPTEFRGDLIEARMTPGHVWQDATDFFGLLARGLPLNPFPSAEAGVQRELEHFGVRPGVCESGAWPAPVKRGLDRAVREGMRLMELPDETAGGWIWQNPVHSDYGSDFLLRARNAIRCPGPLGMEEAIYFFTECDSAASPLHGANRYRIRFNAGALPPVDCFWSVSLYAKPGLTLVANPAGRYSVGSLTPGLRLGPDGGLDINIAAREPKDTNGNWLPAPNGEFTLILRAYMPRTIFLDGSYTLPPCERMTDTDPDYHKETTP